MATIIESIEHKLSGPYVKESVIKWRPLTSEGVAEEAANAIRADDEQGFDWLAGDEKAQLEHECRRAEESAREAQERIEELEQELSEAQNERDDAQQERDEAEDKLAGKLNEEGWSVERERDLEFRTAESYALNRLCVKLVNWAGRNKQKADVLRFIKECKQECDKATRETIEKFEGMVA
jgi:chromosome segregation ATPase